MDTYLTTLPNAPALSDLQRTQLLRLQRADKLSHRLSELSPAEQTLIRKARYSLYRACDEAGVKPEAERMLAESARRAAELIK